MNLSTNSLPLFPKVSSRLVTVDEDRSVDPFSRARDGGARGFNGRNYRHSGSSGGAVSQSVGGGTFGLTSDQISLNAINDVRKVVFGSRSSVSRICDLHKKSERI